MSLRRIAKTGGALMSAQGVNLITQLLLPPIFLRNYSIAVYGEWLTLTATVGYLSTLNFGLPTFANNQVAIFYNRGELDGANTIQATALSLLLSIIFVVAVITGLVFWRRSTIGLALKPTDLSYPAPSIFSGCKFSLECFSATSRAPSLPLALPTVERTGIQHKLLSASWEPQLWLSATHPFHGWLRSSCSLSFSSAALL